MRHREMRQTQNGETEVKHMECNDKLSSDYSSSLPLVEYSDSDNGMDVNEVHSPKHFMKRNYRRQRSQLKRDKRSLKIREEIGDLKQLLRLISNML